MLLLALLALDVRPRSERLGPWFAWAFVMVALCAGSIVFDKGWPT